MKRILAAVAPLDAEVVSLDQAMGRTLARVVKAARATPPADTSAMDGYAVRYGDLSKLPVALRISGEAPAGSPFPGKVATGMAVRIFTGGLVPQGADTVVIQENTRREGDVITILKSPAKGANIRRAGMDFARGDVLFSPGKPLNARDLALIAAANRDKVSVAKRPRVALFSTGDELVAPGSRLKAGSVINSNVPALAALVTSVGGDPVLLGIVPDNLKAIEAAFRKAQKADIIISLGGASVGDYDFVQDAFKNSGGTLDFWKIAMKPGKPLMFGKLNGVPLLGLPGNPVSAYVTAVLYLLPALRKMQAQKTIKPREIVAAAGNDIPATADRETFYLGTLSHGKNGCVTAQAFPRQDSAKISALQAASCLIRRKARASAVVKGDFVTVLPLT